MASPRNMESPTAGDVPKHVPIDMAVAPEANPYGRTHIIHSPSSTPEVPQHSLSPEKLGVAGYVRDVAGFVKDLVHGSHQKKDKRQAQKRGDDRHNTEDTSADEEPSRDDHKQNPTDQNHVDRTQTSASRSRSPFAEAVTSMFPGLNPREGGCTHADDLRADMVRARRLSDPDADDNWTHGHQGIVKRSS